MVTGRSATRWAGGPSDSTAYAGGTVLTCNPSKTFGTTDESECLLEEPDKPSQSVFKTCASGNDRQSMLNECGLPYTILQIMRTVTSIYVRIDTQINTSAHTYVCKTTVPQLRHSSVESPVNFCTTRTCRALVMQAPRSVAKHEGLVPD